MSGLWKAVDGGIYGWLIYESPAGMVDGPPIAGGLQESVAKLICHEHNCFSGLLSSAKVAREIVHRCGDLNTYEFLRSTVADAEDRP